MFDSDSALRLDAFDQFLRGDLPTDQHITVERWISARPQWQEAVQTLRSLNMSGYPRGVGQESCLHAHEDWIRISEMIESKALQQQARTVSLERARARPYILKNYLDVKLRRRRARIRVPKDPGDMLIRAERIRRAIYILIFVGMSGALGWLVKIMLLKGGGTTL